MNGSNQAVQTAPINNIASRRLAFAGAVRYTGLQHEPDTEERERGLRASV
jgi:hypothetical protein